MQTSSHHARHQLSLELDICRVQRKFSAAVMVCGSEHEELAAVDQVRSEFQGYGKGWIQIDMFWNLALMEAKP